MKSYKDFTKKIETMNKIVRNNVKIEDALKAVFKKDT
jgi:hypothetical protein